MGRALVRFFWSTCVLHLYFVFCDLNLLIYAVHLSEVQCAFFFEARCFCAFCFETCRGSKELSFTVFCASYLDLVLQHTYRSYVSYVFLKRNLYYEWIPFVLLFFCADHRVNIVYVQNIMWYSASICCWKTVFQADYKIFLRNLTRNKGRGLSLCFPFSGCGWFYVAITSTVTVTLPPPTPPPTGHFKR